MKKAAALAAVFAAGIVLYLWNRPSGSEPIAERNRKFEESMSGVTLIGYSTSAGRTELSKEERYVIEGVTHMAGDTWLVRSRLQYGGKDIPVPIPLSVFWAGDTPVLTLTDLTIPGVGTFTARVLLYRGQYSGTWSGHGSGGQLFGRIEKNSR